MLNDNNIAKIKIGETLSGDIIYNNPIEGSGDCYALCGEHGTGKTTLMKKICIEYSGQDVPCLVLDLNGAFKSEVTISPCTIDSDFERSTLCVNVATDGIPCSFLHNCLNITDNDQIESDHNQLVTHALRVFDISPKAQKSVVSVLMSATVVNRLKTLGFNAWREALVNNSAVIGERVCNEVLTKMAPLFTGKYFKDEYPQFQLGKITVWDMTDIPQTNKWALGEMALNTIWLDALAGKYKESGFIIAIDEVQQANLNPDGAVQTIINQGRKYGLGLILAAQNMRENRRLSDSFSACDHKFYFRQRIENARYLARTLMPKDVTEYTSKLSNLPIGHFYVDGPKMLSNMSITALLHGYTIIE